MDAHSNGETVVAYGEKSFTETTKDVPFAIVEKPPQFPGCEGDAQELKKCLQASISNHVGRNFNADLSNTLNLESGVHKINVMFRIDKEGNIVDIKARASHIKMAEEAIRVIESLPNLIPGEQRGEKVSIQYALPIKFKIE